MLRRAQNGPTNDDGLAGSEWDEETAGLQMSIVVSRELIQIDQLPNQISKRNARCMYAAAAEISLGFFQEDSSATNGCGAFTTITMQWLVGKPWICCEAVEFGRNYGNENGAVRLSFPNHYLPA